MAPWARGATIQAMAGECRGDMAVNHVAPGVDGAGPNDAIKFAHKRSIPPSSSGLTATPQGSNPNVGAGCTDCVQCQQLHGGAGGEAPRNECSSGGDHDRGSVRPDEEGPLRGALGDSKGRVAALRLTLMQRIGHTMHGERRCNILPAALRLWSAQAGRPAAQTVGVPRRCMRTRSMWAGSLRRTSMELPCPSRFVFGATE